MNIYFFEDISIGLVHEFTVKIDEEKQNLFYDLSGDVNPLHCSEEHAINCGFKGRVVYGMLTASFYSTLVGVYLPGERCLLHEVNTKFIKPVYVNDTLDIKGQVVEKNDTFKLLVIKAEIRNQHDECVARAKIKVGVLE